MLCCCKTLVQIPSLTIPENARCLSVPSLVSQTGLFIVVFFSVFSVNKIPRHPIAVVHSQTAYVKLVVAIAFCKTLPRAKTCDALTDGPVDMVRTVVVLVVPMRCVR